MNRSREVVNAGAVGGGRCVFFLSGLVLIERVWRESIIGWIREHF